MRVKLFVVAVVVGSAIVGALAFGPVHSNASTGITPSATPVRKKTTGHKSKPKPKGWLDETSIGTVGLAKSNGSANGSQTNSGASSSTSGSLANTGQTQFKPQSPESNGMAITKGTGVSGTNPRFIGTPSDGNGIKRKHKHQYTGTPIDGTGIKGKRPTHHKKLKR